MIKFVHYIRSCEIWLNSCTTISNTNKIGVTFFYFLLSVRTSYPQFNMEEIKLSDDVFEQIKDFDYWSLTEEQELLIDKLILNEELKQRYKKSGLCKECKQPNTGYNWCQTCNGKRFQ